MGEKSNAQSTEQNAYRGEYRAEKDLEAQQWMARWAMVTGIATGVTVILVLLTLIEANETAKAAVDAGKAAWASEQTARDVGQKQSMAYVHAIDARIPKRSNPDEPTLNALSGLETARLVVQFENIGETVAKDIEVHFGLFDEKFSNVQYREIEYPNKREFSNIAPGQKPEFEIISDLPTAIEKSEQIDGVTRGVTLRLLRGEIRYSDVFGNQFRSAFLYLVMFGIGMKIGMKEDAPCFGLFAKMPAFELIERTKQSGKD